MCFDSNGESSASTTVSFQKIACSATIDEPSDIISSYTIKDSSAMKSVDLFKPEIAGALS